MPDDEPFDLLSAAIGALRDLYQAEADRPLEPLRDDEPAPLWPVIEHP